MLYAFINILFLQFDVFLAASTVITYEQIGANQLRDLWKLAGALLSPSIEISIYVSRADSLDHLMQ